jgi:hypothetical protein
MNAFIRRLSEGKENNNKFLCFGHEMAHAAISNFFVAIPPVKVSELFAMYVEYNLIKDKKEAKR